MAATEVKRVSSGKLRAIGYAAATRTLQIQLDTGALLQYSVVPQEVRVQIVIVERRLREVVNDGNGSSCARSPGYRELPLSGVLLSFRSPCCGTDERLELAESREPKCFPKAVDGKLGIGDGRLSGATR